MDANDHLRMIRQKAAELDADNREIDWDQRKIAWLHQISNLYQQVTAWLDPLIVDGTINISQGTQPIQEQFIGFYEAPTLQIEVRRTQITLKPRATLVVGSYGRVDMESPTDKTLFVLVEDADNPRSIEHAHWHVVSQIKRTITAPLDADEFYSAFSRSIGIR